MLILTILKVRRGNKKVWEFSDSFGISTRGFLSLLVTNIINICPEGPSHTSVLASATERTWNIKRRSGSSPFKPKQPRVFRDKTNDEQTDETTEHILYSLRFAPKGRFWSLCLLRGESETWIGRSDPQCCYWIGPAPCQSQPTDQSEAALTRAQGWRLSCCR